MSAAVCTTMVCVALMVAGAGCGVAPSSEELTSVSDEIQRSDPAERVVTTLPLRSEDLVDLPAREAALNAACPVPATCPGFDSCASWSSTTSCGGVECGFECERCNFKVLTCTTGLERSTFSSRFRVCFNAQQQACTEFQVFTATTCQTLTSGDCCSQFPGTCGQVFPL